MKKILPIITGVLLVPLFFLVIPPNTVFSQELPPQCLNGTDCTSCPRCGGDVPAKCCCNGAVVGSAEYASRCQCEPAGGDNSNPCDRYAPDALNYSLSDSGCSDNVCTSINLTKCFNPDYTGISNYSYSCDSLGATPPPVSPAPGEYQCTGLPYCDCSYNNWCDAHFEFEGLTCDSQCTDPDYPHKCVTTYYTSIPEYLFDCEELPRYDGFPGTNPPGGLVPPDPNLEGWPPDYPDPPAEAYPVPYVRCADVRPDPDINPADPYADPRLKETEFHSLRPYQASPCDRNFRDLALYCGNSLILQVDQTVDYNYHNPPGSCTDLGDEDRCYWTFSGAETVGIDLSGAEYPIMGYTEPSRNNLSDPYKVVNALNPNPADETVSDTAKVNEYVSWYLQGTMDHAEEPPLDVSKNCIGETSGREGVCRDAHPLLVPNACTLRLASWSFDGKGGCGDYDQYCCVSSAFDPQSDTLDRYKLVNLSGPIRKLVPQNVQFSEREDQVNNAYNSLDPRNQHVRHNQVAGCIIGIDIPFTDYTLGGIQLPCYLPRFGNYSTNTFIDGVRLAKWREDNKLPPRPEDYTSYSDYLNAVHTWRGLICVSIIVPPLPGPLSIFSGWSFDMCLDNPAEANYYSNLYDNIPLSPTEDMLGYTEAYTSAAVQSNTQNVTITQASFVPDEYGFAFLYVPHMDETDETGKILQKTYAPAGADLTASSVNVSAEVDDFCDLREVRTNPGDQLFAGEITGTVNYEALVNQTFYNGDGTSGEGCESLGGRCRDYSMLPICNTYYDNFDCPSSAICCVGFSGYATSRPCTDFGGYCLPNSYSCAVQIAGYENACPSGYTCSMPCNPSLQVPIQHYTAPIRVELKLRTAIPKADEVWKRLVAGAAGVARRMFPKIMADSNSPFEFFWDMPGETSVSYSASTPVASGNPYSIRVKGGEAAKLYFPHLGGIKEYFLNGIQTLIRPKGYGNYLTQTSGNTIDDTVVDSVDCDLGHGPCSPENLAQYFPGHEYEASGICQAESSSNPFAMNTHCLNSADGIDNDNDGLTDMSDPNYDGATADYSVGLFQINMLAHCAGNVGFSQWSLSPPYLCVISNQTVVDNCVNDYQNEIVNINYAVQLSNNGQDWTPWTNAAIKCGLL